MFRVFILTALAAFLSFASAEEVSFESDVSCKKADEMNFSTIKSGDKLVLKPGETAFVLSKNGVPLLIYPSAKDSRITVTDANFASLLSEMLQPQLEKSSSEIIDGLRRADSLIQKRDFNQAAQVILPLRTKFPRISSVLFMDGTIHYLLNDRATAIADLEKGLQIDPGNEDAKRLVAKLRGGP